MRARTRRLRSFCFGIAKSPSFCSRARSPAAKPSNEGFAFTDPGVRPPFASDPFFMGDLRWGKIEEVRRESSPRRNCTPQHVPGQFAGHLAALQHRRTVDDDGADAF